MSGYAAGTSAKLLPEERDCLADYRAKAGRSEKYKEAYLYMADFLPRYCGAWRDADADAEAQVAADARHNGAARDVMWCWRRVAAPLDDAEAWLGGAHRLSLDELREHTSEGKAQPASEKKRSYGPEDYRPATEVAWDDAVIAKVDADAARRRLITALSLHGLEQLTTSAERQAYAEVSEGVAWADCRAFKAELFAEANALREAASGKESLPGAC